MPVSADATEMSANNSVFIWSAHLPYPSGYKNSPDRFEADSLSWCIKMRPILLKIKSARLEQRAQGQKFDALSERVTRVEESTKQAHHRLNRLDGGE